MNNNPILYIVSTPIGNLKDITFRAIETLNYVDYIVCENPNNSKKLLSFYNINKKLIQLNSLQESDNSINIINILNNGNNVAYISDAGTPCISDPGNILILNCIKNNIKIEVIPGASALLTSLVGSGLDLSNFTFIGFLSSKKGTKINQLKQYSKINSTLIFYESSHRILETLSIIKEIFNKDNKICIAKELTKIHETYYRYKINDLDISSINDKGEFVIIIENKINNTINITNEEIYKLLYDLIYINNQTKKEAISFLVKKYNLSKNLVYKISLILKK